MDVPAHADDGSPWLGDTGPAPVQRGPARGPPGARPAPRAPSGSEIQVSVRAISRLVGCEDRQGSRRSARAGTYFTARWVAGQSSVSGGEPVQAAAELRGVAHELEAAGRERCPSSRVT
jgi:hypothetical protein